MGRVFLGTKVRNFKGVCVCDGVDGMLARNICLGLKFGQRSVKFDSAK